jgi:hypothetical protein
MSSRTITGMIYHDDGSAWAGGFVRFVLCAAFTTGTGVQPKDDWSVTLDANGAFSISLAVPDSGTAYYKIVTPDEHSHTVYLADGPATDLQTLLGLEGSLVSQDAALTVIDAHVRAYGHAVSVKHYGAMGDGVHDDTSAIQAAIDATPAFDNLHIPTGVYKLTAALVCNNDINIVGDGVTELFDDFTKSWATVPGRAPWLVGTVLLQTAAGANGIEMRGTTRNVSLHGIGIKFDDSIAFNNTGHGIYAKTDQAITGGFEGGVVNATWENIVIFGHDGNHYAFYLYNFFMGHCSHLRSYGGGGWSIEGDAAGGAAYGNSILTDLCFVVFVAGSAHAFYEKAKAGTGLNVLIYTRPLGWVLSIATTPIALAYTFSPPTSAQYIWLDDGDPALIYLISPDMETMDAIASPVSFGSGTYIDQRGAYFAAPNGVYPSYKTKPFWVGEPTLTFGLGAGEAGTVTGGLVATQLWYNDERGKVAFIAGTNPTPADWNMICEIEFKSWRGIGAVIIQPVPYGWAEQESMDAKFYPFTSAGIITDHSFQVWAHTQLTAGHKYAFQYLVIQ